jgi:serine protease Do
MMRLPTRPHAVRERIAALLAAILIIGLPVSASAERPGLYEVADLKALERTFVQLAETIRPSVVAVRTYQARDAGDVDGRSVLRPFSQGSGFVIGPDGYIATNRHVIADADIIYVVLNSGLRFEGIVVQADPRSDLAVLKIDAEGLAAVRFGDLSGLKINQWVFACGNPFGLANDDGRTSVAYGAVSALGRQMTHRLVGGSDVEYYGNMIETTAAINPGSSGGPLFNLNGEVVGVVTAIETTSGANEGHGFAIPIDKHTRRILDLLKDGQTVRYGFLGVQVRDVDSPASRLVVDSRVHRGALVHSIDFRDGPAARAGLKPDDIVIEYDGVAIEDFDHFVRLVGFTPVGTEVPVTFLRGGVKRTTVVTVGDRAELIGRADR